MSFTQDLCDRAEYLDWHLTRLPPASTPNPCPICLSPYSGANPPFSLLECSHTFCQPCILAWFTSEQENAHTCPLDRTELFLPRALDDPKRTIIHTIHGWETTVVHGLLTPEGCKHVVRDLWIGTAPVVQDAEAGRVAGRDGSGWVTESVLWEVIRDVFPTGVASVVVALPGLMLRFARAMVGWHAEGGFWADVWQAPRWVASDELSGFVETLYEACGAGEG
jgi:hypothetical protein